MGRSLVRFGACWHIGARGPDVPSADTERRGERVKILEIDFETRSRIQIGGVTGVGLFNYATHPWTQVLMMGYKLPGSDVVQLWEPDLDPIPMSIKTALEDPAVVLMAFNSAFERYILKYKLGYDIPVERF